MFIYLLRQTSWKHNGCSRKQWVSLENVLSTWTIPTSPLNLCHQKCFEVNELIRFKNNLKKGVILILFLSQIDSQFSLLSSFSNSLSITMGKAQQWPEQTGEWLCKSKLVLRKKNHWTISMLLFQHIWTVYITFYFRIYIFDKF